MERFQKIKANRRKLDVSTICRFCGLENHDDNVIVRLTDEGVEFTLKVSSMMSINVYVSDRMPQKVCNICYDKINDFYEFRLMALNTDKQTREALGLPHTEKKTPTPQDQIRPKKIQLETMQPVVRLVDLKYSIQDQLLIRKAFVRMAQSNAIKQEPNIPAIKRHSNVSFTVTSNQHQQQLQQPPIKKPRKDISCSICVDANFSYLNDLQDHQIKEHLPLVSKYACGSCRETFEQLSDFKAHETMHSKTKLPYTCYICYSPYAKLRDFQKHMTNYNCKEKEKVTVSVEDIRCFQCKKKFLTQNLFEWHGCFIRTRSSCLKCGQYFQKKKMLLKHYVQCPDLFVTPEAARDPNKVKSEMISPSSRGAVVRVTGVRKKTVPQRRMTTFKAEKEVSLASVTHQQSPLGGEVAAQEEEDEYANYEEDITYDNFGSDDEDVGTNMNNLEPVVQLQETAQASAVPQPPAPLPAFIPRIISIKAEVSSEQETVKQHKVDTQQLIRSIKREQGGKQAVVSTTANKAQQQPALRIKAERGANEQPVVQVLNPLAIGSSAKTTTAARKKVFKLPHELAMKIKQEKMSEEYGDGVRDEAEPDSEEEAQMQGGSSQDSQAPPSAIKEEKLDSAYGDAVQRTKQLINPMALAMMREKNAATIATVMNGSEGNSLVISAVTSMSGAIPSTNGRQTAEQKVTEPACTRENSNSSVKESSAPAQVANPVMVEIPAEFSKEQHISPAVVVEMSSTVSAENNEVATTSVTTATTTTTEAMNTNDDDELNQLLENLEKYAGDDGIGDVVVGEEGAISVANDLQDLLKFD